MLPSDPLERAGAADEFSAEVAAEMPGLYRYAISLVGNRSDAEDAVGDTVVRALEHRDQYRGDASIRTWLHRILDHIVVDRARREGREMQADEVSAGEVEQRWRDEDYSVDPAIVAERAASRDELRSALVHLPHGYRAVVVLHDAEGWSVREVAEVLGIGLPAAKQRLRRGRMMLVSTLGGEQERRTANSGVPLGCWDARRQVSDYLDGELDGDRRRLLEEHLARCSTCPPLYQALVGVRDSLGTLHDPDTVVSPELARRIGRR